MTSRRGHRRAARLGADRHRSQPSRATRTSRAFALAMQLWEQAQPLAGTLGAALPRRDARDRYQQAAADNPRGAALPSPLPLRPRCAAPVHARPDARPGDAMRRPGSSASRYPKSTPATQDRRACTRAHGRREAVAGRRASSWSSAKASRPCSPPRPASPTAARRCAGLVRRDQAAARHVPRCCPASSG